MNLEEILREITTENNEIKHVHQQQEEDATNREISSVIKSQQIKENIPFDTLYSHQAEALKELKQNNNVCVTTPTSSGKTLVYALDIARKYNKNTDATFLLVYPTKALSRDQKSNLEKLYNKLEINIDIGVYDGDTSRDEKQRIRQESNIIITNFQGLNYYLPHYDKWSRIFNNLETVVIDEAHTYTGVHGIHVSMIIRRLRRVFEYKYLSEPDFILSSATIGNPKEHAYNLTGKNFTVISNDGSPQGKQSIILWNPPKYMDDDNVKRKSSNRESSKIMSHLVENDIQTIMFAPSRKTTELGAKWTNEMLDNENKNVTSYNAGHTKKERRNVENKLKNGTINGVVSTTALELGIDIGDIEATIINSYPGNKSSFWQQAGRSGRGKRNSITVLVADNTSIDQYIIDNPSYLISGDIENAVIDLTNEYILKQHIIAAANEVSIQELDIKYYFSDSPARDTINKLQQKGILNGNVEDGVYYAGEDRPESNIDIYSTSTEQYDLYIDFGDDKQKLPPVEKTRAFREFHPNAIYMYKGNQYKVTSFNQEKQEILLEYADVNYYTESSREVSIKNISCNDKKEITENIIVKRGTATVQQKYNTYSRVYYKDGERDYNLPTGLDDSIEINTDIMWIETRGKTKTDIEENAAVDGLEGSLHAAEHSLIKMSPTVITADNKDLGGLSTRNHPDTNGSSIFIYDGIDGGVGFSHEIYDNIKKLAEKTYDMLKSCSCTSDHGCPACTMSPMCGDNNEPMDSNGAQYLLKQLQN